MLWMKIAGLRKNFRHFGYFSVTHEHSVVCLNTYRLVIKAYQYRHKGFLKRGEYKMCI